MQVVKISAVLCLARDSISQKGHWTQGAFARSIDGAVVPSDHPTAHARCGTGALHLEIYRRLTLDTGRRAEQYLHDAARLLFARTRHRLTTSLDTKPPCKSTIELFRLLREQVIEVPQNRVPVVSAAIVDRAIEKRTGLTLDEIHRELQVEGNEFVNDFAREQPEVVRFLQWQSINLTSMLQNSKMFSQKSMELVHTVFSLQLDAAAHLHHFLKCEVNGGGTE